MKRRICCFVWLFLHNLPLEENKEIVAQLCGEMGAMLKEINDPWYTEKILSDRIPY